jgi:hypothetical protein
MLSIRYDAPLNKIKCFNASNYDPIKVVIPVSRWLSGIILGLGANLATIGHLTAFSG